MPTPTSRLQGALIGCGFVSRHHLSAWSKIPEAQIVAICDLDRRRLEPAMRLAPAARTYTEAASLFQKEPGLDFVEICTGPRSHRPLVELEAQHGVHVLCQKPAAAERSDLVAMVAACEARKTRLMIHENWRFRAWSRALRDEVAFGAIGEPLRFRLAHRDTRALRPDGYDDQPFLRTRPRLILLEMGCHLIDTARFVMGEVTKVSATLARHGRYSEGEETAIVLLTFASGALGLLDMTWCAPPDLARPEWALNETVIEGSEGTLRLLTDGSLEWISPTGLRERIPVALPPDDLVYLEAYIATQRHFIAGLRTGEPHETDGAETLRTMDVVWTAYQSAAEGRTLSVPS